MLAKRSRDKGEQERILRDALQVRFVLISTTLVSMKVLDTFFSSFCCPIHLFFCLLISQCYRQVSHQINLEAICSMFESGKLSYSFKKTGTRLLPKKNSKIGTQSNFLDASVYHLLLGNNLMECSWIW